MDHAHGSSRMRFGPPFYPAAVDFDDGALMLSPEARFPKSSKFTQSFLTHGRWANNTLDEATNLKERQHRLRERTTRKMELLSDKFRWEVQEVDRIQKTVRARQRRIAEAHLRACCTIMIQVAWRGYKARVFCRELRAQKLGKMLAQAWRRFKRRRYLPILKNFVNATIQTRKERKEKIIKASLKIQRAWRRRVWRAWMGRIVLARAAIEAAIENLLVEFTHRVHNEAKGAIILRAWRNSHRRAEDKDRKSRGGRVFVTQSHGSSPRRKGQRTGGLRSGGITSDPSSPTGSSRRSPPTAPGIGRGGHNKEKISSTNAAPPTLSFASAVTAMAKPTMEPPVATTAAAAAATTNNARVAGSERVGERRQPESRCDVFDQSESPKSTAGCASTSGRGGGGTGRQTEDAVENIVDGSSGTRSWSSHQKSGECSETKTKLRQPRRPSSEKPSKASDAPSRRTSNTVPGRKQG